MLSARHVVHDPYAFGELNLTELEKCWQDKIREGKKDWKKRKEGAFGGK